MKKIIMSLVFVTVIMLSAISVFAADGFYAGIGLGSSKSDVFKVNGCDPGDKCDDTDSGWKLFGGYQFNQNVGLELGYIDLGKITLESGPFKLEGKTSGFNLAAVGTVPVSEQFGVFGKAGFLGWKTKITANVPFPDASGSGTKMMFGIGGKYNINKQISVRAEWERFKDIVFGKDDPSDPFDINLISLGITFAL